MVSGANRSCTALYNNRSRYCSMGLLALMYCVVCAQSFKSNKSKCAAMCEVFVLSAFCRKSHTVALGLLFKSSPQMTTGNRYYTCYLVDCNTNPCAPICKNFSVSAFSGTIIRVSSASRVNPPGSTLT